MAVKVPQRISVALATIGMWVVLSAVVAPTGEAQTVQACSAPYPPAGWMTSGPGPGTEQSSPGFRIPVGTETVLTGVTEFSDRVAGETTVQVELTSGLVTLTDAGAYLWHDEIGDLDGDGLNDYWISAGPTGTRSQIPAAAWVLSGATAAGDYNVASVAVEVPSARAWLLPGGSRGWAGGGPDDLLLYGPGTDTTWRTFALDGNEVMAAGPGGDASGLAPISDVGGYPGYVGTLPRLGDALLTGEAVDAQDASAGGLIWVSVDQGPRLLSSYPLRWEGFSRAVATESGTDGFFLTMSIVAPSGSQFAVWRLDDPCAGFPLTGPTPAAEPVAVAPAFTG